MNKITLKQRLKALDMGALVVIIITFILFALSLFLKGFTHDILLETGIFLVSVKLILMSHKSNLIKESMDIKLNNIHNAFVKYNSCNRDDSGQFASGLIDKGKKQL